MLTSAEEPSGRSRGPCESSQLASRDEREACVTGVGNNERKSESEGKSEQGHGRSL